MKACEFCGEELVKRPEEPGPHFARRKTCGRACMGQMARQRRVPPEPKTCAQCGAPFAQGATERTNSFNRRTTCSHGCAITLSAQSRGLASQTSPANRKRLATPSKTCRICGTPFSQRSNESLSRYALRTTCSTACRLRAKWVDPPAKDCVMCGVSFNRRQTEPLASYRLRETCSRACHLELRGKARRTGTGRVGPYPVAFDLALRDQIRDRDQHTCQGCGAVEDGRAHAVHHVDYDKANLAETNLISLCLACHSKSNADRTGWQRRLTALLVAP